MHISSKQFDYLTTMGISLWQARDGVYQNNLGQHDNENVAAIVPKNKLCNDATSKAVADVSAQNNGKVQLKSHQKETVEQTKVVKCAVNTESRLFSSVDDAIAQLFIKDLILALGLNENQVALTDDGLMLGKLHWQVSTPQTCTLDQHKLITTNIQELCNSAAHKAQLWRCLSTYLNQQ